LDIGIKNNSLNESTLIWAIVCSILLHILFAVVMPNFKFDVAKKIPDQLTVEIMQPKPLEPVVIPEPPAPIEQAKPEPIKPLPKKISKPDPSPIKELSPEPVQTESPPPPAVIAVAPKVDTAPVITVPPPPPEPPKPTGPSDGEIRAERNSYKALLTREIAKHQKYHPLAIQRGLEGTTVVTVEINSSGKIVNTHLCKSSGETLLDKSAVEAVKNLNTLPLPRFMEVFTISDDEQISCPENIVIQNGNKAIKCPISFKLNK
jgi:periplasmic protein TonB